MNRQLAIILSRVWSFQVSEVSKVSKFRIFEFYQSSIIGSIHKPIITMRNKTQKNMILLVDAMNLMYRSFYAMPQLKNRDGQCLGAGTKKKKKKKTITKFSSFLLFSNI